MLNSRTAELIEKDVSTGCLFGIMDKFSRRGVRLFGQKRTFLSGFWVVPAWFASSVFWIHRPVL